MARLLPKGSNKPLIKKQIQQKKQVFKIGLSLSLLLNLILLIKIFY